MHLYEHDPIRTLILRFQKNEATDHLVYRRLAEREKNPENRAVLLRIANDEKEHVTIWRRYSGVEVAPDRRRVFLYRILGWLLGFTFVVKIMEKGENDTVAQYESLIADVPEVQYIIEQEGAHEASLHAMLDEERLRYAGAMVLGLNDALVELTGTLAGLTFALADATLVALAGIVTGVSATLSMAASNYLAERADGKPDALKSSLYTGTAYLVTVVLLILPYLLFPDGMYLAALATMLAIVILVIFFFNYYIAIAKSQSFRHRFSEMAVISLGVAMISFFIGLLAKHFLGVEL